MKLETADGTVHAATRTTVKDRQPSGAIVYSKVIKTKCGTPATGCMTSLPVDCPDCLGR